MAVNIESPRVDELIDQLRQLTKKLLVAWYQQSDMTRHYGAQVMGLNLR